MMTRFAPFSFVADIIVADGRVHMLELGYLKKSGLLGYKKAYGIDPLPAIEAFEDRVDPRYESDAPNHNSNARLTTLNKAIFYALLAGQCSAVFPETKLYPMAGMQALAEPIQAEFAEPDIVVKVPVMNRGEGIYIAPRKALANPVMQQTIDNKLQLNVMDVQSPALAVQARVTPDPVLVAGRPYAPTMRVLMTAYQDPDGAFAIRYHGASYRLPEADMATARTLHEKFLCLATRDERDHAAAPVPAPVFTSVCAQLNATFKPAFADVFFADPLDLASGLMADKRPGIQLAGLDFTSNLRPHKLPEPEKLYNVTLQAKELAENDVIARRYLWARGHDDDETWSPALRDLYKYAQNIPARGNKPVIRIKASPAQAQKSLSL